MRFLPLLALFLSVAVVNDSLAATAPAVTIGTAQSLANGQVTLTAYVTANGDATSVNFYYSTTQTPKQDGISVAAPAVAPTAVKQQVSVTIPPSGQPALTAGTAYYFQVFANSAAGSILVPPSSTALTPFYSAALGGGGLLGFSVTDANGNIVGDLRLDLLSSGVFTASLDLNHKLYHFNGALSQNGSYSGIATTGDEPVNTILTPTILPGTPAASPFGSSSTSGTAGGPVISPVTPGVPGSVTSLAPVGKARIVPVTLNVSFADSTMSVSIANGLYTASQALGALSPVGRATIQGRYTVELPPINSTSTTTNGSTVSVDVTASAADNSPTLTLTAAVPSDVAIGWTVSGNGIPTGATVAGVSGDVITLSADTTAAISASAIVLSGPTNGTTSSQTTSPQDIPQGTGWMVVKLDAYGSAELEGMAGDGQAFSTRAYLGGSDSAPTLPFYWSKHEDTLAGSLAITPGTATTTSSTTTATTTLAGSTVAGTITYIRAKSHNQYYPRGFTQSITATGAAYIPAKPMHRTLEGGGYSGRLATLASSGSDLASFSDNLDFSEMDRCSVTDSNPANLNVRLRRPTGIIGGTFQDLNTGNTIHYAGVVLQSATSVGSGAGVFRGMHQSGTVTLTLTADTTSTTGTTTGTTTTGTTGTNGIPIVTTPTTGTSTTTGTNGLIGNQGTGNPILPGVTQ